MFFEYPDGGGANDDSASFLTGTDASSWATLVEHCEVRRLRTGECVIAVGDDERSLLIVTDGMLEASIPRGRRSRVRTIGRFGPGSVVGELSFLDGRPRSANVVAVGDAEVLRLTFQSFETLAARHASLARSMLLDLGRIAAGRVRQLNRQVEQLA